MKCINAKLQTEILHFFISTIKQGDTHNIYLFRKYYLKKKTLLWNPNMHHIPYDQYQYKTAFESFLDNMHKISIKTIHLVNLKSKKKIHIYIYMLTAY
jgi:hypothetical protein